MDFVKEIRLTPKSFIALIGFESNSNSIGTLIGLAAIGNDFLTIYNVTKQNDLPIVKGPDGIT